VRRFFSSRSPREPRPSDLEALRVLLQEYDRANRLEIDAVYAQFSPTLDDYYAEELRIEFPRNEQDLYRGAEVRPELALTRTVPGHEPRSVHAPGAPFPLERAWELFGNAVACAPVTRGQDMWERVDADLVWLRPEQVGHTQAVRLVLEPDGSDALEILEELQRPGPGC